MELKGNFAFLNDNDRRLLGVKTPSLPLEELQDRLAGARQAAAYRQQELDGRDERLKAAGDLMLRGALQYDIEDVARLNRSLGAMNEQLINQLFEQAS